MFDSYSICFFLTEIFWNNQFPQICVLQKLSIHRLYFGGFKDFFGFCVVLLLMLLIFVLVFGSFWF